ncbi:MAG: orotate phosphoribosyltransferase [Ruminococcus sp.]|nr:orotate phosphoribosyltransferase [Ruminococcus sp.]
MTYQETFIRFMVDCNVLTFGDFTLKSGRKAPYFINAGNYHNGAQLLQLGRYYAACIEEHKIPVETLFGPAYKGIPLAAATVMAMADLYNKTVDFCFDRKEQKDHGEGGMFVGKQLCDGEKVVIIEDVMTSGKAMAEVYPKLKQEADVEITGMVITVDRKERALEGTQSAVTAVYEKYGVPVYSIVTIDDIIRAIQDEIIPGKEHLAAMLAYREQYGVS